MKNRLKYEVHRFLRLAITGQESSPPLTDIIKSIGVDEAFKRINTFCDKLLENNIVVNNITIEDEHK